MENIHIFDKFLEDADYETLKQFVYDSKWKYGHRNGKRETLDTLYFSNMFMDNFISDYVRNKIERAISKPLKITRNYLQTQQFGENGGYHIDTEDPNTYTFCVYITDVPDDEIEEASGEFLLKLPGEIHILAIDTYANRGVLFPSNYVHKGMAYNRQIDKRRTVLAWKFEEII